MIAEPVCSCSAIRETPHPSRQHVHPGLAEEPPMGRHSAFASIRDAVAHVRLRSAVEPHVVDEARRPEGGIAGAVRTVTGHAQRIVLLLSGRRVEDRKNNPSIFDTGEVSRRVRSVRIEPARSARWVESWDAPSLTRISCASLNSGEMVASGQARPAPHLRLHRSGLPALRQESHPGDRRQDRRPQ